MKTFIPAIMALLFVLNAGALEKAEPKVALFKGVYQGKVFNGDDFDPVLTTLSLAENGELKGTYAMTEEDGVAPGTLSDFKWEGEFVLVCTWKDKYGSGTLRMLFSSDLSVFRGFWGDDSKSTFLPWDGVKKEQPGGRREVDKPTVDA